MPFELPQNFDVNLPDFQQFANDAIGKPEDNFAPNPDLPRVTDAQRAEDARVFKEQINAAENLKDSIQVANKYVDAAVAATKLGKSLIQYQIGIQDIRTEKVQYAKAVTRTEIAQTELTELQLKLNFQNEALPHIKAEYDNRLIEVRGKADRALRKAEAFVHETNQRFPGTIDVQAQPVPAPMFAAG